ncbi:GAF domain-containing protein [Tolypothrix sp. FACHB-123]|uniref:methyl-accepting chemotaxis protein n=1 Tax=Tolypothrix sp. FACHB-123 TaxID=2692868 RepID=UPI00168329FE|nr:methyl-accepting chemotaxis protein [Tolypothrix sp. FACHB-123]MBD2355343.1 GAF domain-containing protein [Tolypothrix sp. FACHB-123]
MNNGLHPAKNGLVGKSQLSSLKSQFNVEFNSNSSGFFSQIQAKKADYQAVKQSLFQRFANLSINHKQLIALTASQLIGIGCISIVGRTLITNSLQNISLEQAKSELAIADINYNNKVNQMALGLMGQAENPTLVKAALLHSSGQTLSQELQAEVKQILASQSQVNKIEYVTLVGENFQIIANANTNRNGEVFNPDNLVGDVFTNPQTIKASRTISLEELSKELPILPSGLNNQNALIRYTVTPIKNPDTKAVIGALIAGDIVNGKDQIVKDTLKATSGGYSAVYVRQPNGEFSLATSLDKGQQTNINQAQSNVKLPQQDIALLTAAAKAKGTPVTAKIKLGNQTYAMAAQAVPDKILETDEQATNVFDEKSVAILVRGTPETALNQLLANSFWVEVAAINIALILIIFWTFMLKRGIVNPLQQLEETAQKFARGDRYARSEILTNDEVGQLASTFNRMADAMTAQAIRLENKAQLSELVNEITASFRGSLNTTHILNVAVTSIREAINADRVLIYCFDENWVGKIIAESVDDDWSSTLGQEIADPCFANDYVQKYQNGRVQALENIYAAGLTDCHINQLEKFDVKANLVAPILLDNKLYGLLIAHQCSSSRKWQELEIELLRQVAIPVGYALEQSYLLEQIDTARFHAETAVIEQRQYNEALQQQILTLLKDIEGASQGDLTVRSEVTMGELGTVADFFNSIVESLRAIVTKVKTSAIQVNTSISENEVAIHQLADTVVKQADDISLSLVSIDQMKDSITTVADRARQAAIVAHTASGAVQENGKAIDQAVQNIFKLRSTIGDTAKKVKRLGESSQQISQVVALINQIAMQTNFLAINAGLEATRSGVEGEGFAMIAEEVAALAARCSEATQEITQVVDKIQRETNEVVTAMELGTNQVVEGTTIVENAKNSLNQILQVSQQIDDLVQSISLATESQVNTSQAVSKLMQEIYQVSNLTSSYSHQASQSLKQTVEISQELQATVETFKVN